AGGDTERPMVFLAVAGVINVILNLILVIVFHLDVAGVAIATIVSQYISCFLVIRCLTKEKGPLHLDLKGLRIDPMILKNIATIGLPAGLQGMVFSMSNMVIQSSINSFGDVVMAGSGAAANIEGFVYVSMNAFYQTCLTFTGQNYGAGKPKRVDRVITLCLAFVTVSGILCGALAYVFADPLLHIYSPSDEVVAQGIVRMTYVCLPYFLCGLMDTLVGGLRGLGTSIVPMCVSIIGVCGFRLVWIFTVFQAVRTPPCLYISYPVSWIATAIIHACCLLVVRKKAYKRMDYSAETASTTA
ncbi:MAG: MATE family efflux transporter, partial [Oscillospiraceae bacterium]|nr:MATE family efflux transporter [Oscillospiraceae bacterium]